MAAELDVFKEAKEKAEATEFIEILRTMSDSERQQVKGIMIGIQLSKAPQVNELARVN